MGQTALFYSDIFFEQFFLSFLRLAEEKLRDRLAAAARDKLVQTSKEKQLQAERKRKAAMFITMLKGGSSSGAEDGREGGATGM